jgi:hypothetical protein
VTAAPPIESAQLIQKCETTHGMSQRSERNANSAGDAITFSAWAWPPPPSADPDGYTRIVATAAQGPGQSNASGTNVVDRITGPLLGVFPLVQLRLTGKRYAPLTDYSAA